MCACALAPFPERGGGTWLSESQILVAPGHGRFGKGQPRARWQRAPEVFSPPLGKYPLGTDPSCPLLLARAG